VYYDSPDRRGTLDDLEHVERLHFQALYMLTVTDKLDIVFSAAVGVQPQAGCCHSPQITEVGPRTRRQHDGVAVHGDGQRDRFNVGADMTYRFANNFGSGPSCATPRDGELDA